MKQMTVLCAVLTAAAVGSGCADKHEERARPRANIEQPKSVKQSQEARKRAPEELPPSVAKPDEVTPTTIAPPSADSLAGPTIEPTRQFPADYRQLLVAGRDLIGTSPELAREHLSRALEKRPDALAPTVQMARAYLADGKSRKARPFAEKAVELSPSSSLAWNTLGRVELAEGRRDAAITSFQRAADENENNTYAWNNLGYVHLLAGNHEEAVEALELATSSESVAPYMWNNLGLAYEHLDRLDEARAAYRQGAEAGSSKAAASLERLEGVESIYPVDEVESDAGDEIEIELDVESVEELEIEAEPESESVMLDGTAPVE